MKINTLKYAAAAVAATALLGLAPVAHAQNLGSSSRDCMADAPSAGSAFCTFGGGGGGGFNRPSGGGGGGQQSFNRPVIPALAVAIPASIARKAAIVRAAGMAVVMAAAGITPAQALHWAPPQALRQAQRMATADMAMAPVMVMAAAITSRGLMTAIMQNRATA